MVKMIALILAITMLSILILLRHAIGVLTSPKPSGWRLLLINYIYGLETVKSGDETYVIYRKENRVLGKQEEMDFYCFENKEDIKRSLSAVSNIVLMAFAICVSIILTL